MIVHGVTAHSGLTCQRDFKLLASLLRRCGKSDRFEGPSGHPRTRSGTAQTGQELPFLSTIALLGSGRLASVTVALPWMISSTIADFRRAVQRLIYSSITALIGVTSPR